MVRQIGGQDYPSIGTALENLPPDVLSGAASLRLLLAPGLYREQLHLTVPRLEISGLGKTPADCRISFARGARGLDPSGEPWGTFRTPVVHAENDYLQLENLTIENTAGPGREAGQAIALSLNCARAELKHCRILGDQDTLFLAPLPRAAVLPQGFRGTENWRPRTDCRSYFSDCLIAGGVDFIFGGGAALFENCSIRSLPPSDIGRREETESLGYITAASTPRGQAFGLVFAGCRLLSDCSAGSVYLGRPWREYAQTAFIGCHFAAHIRPAGWHDWHKTEAQKTVFYAESENDGPGALNERRVSWCRRLSAEEGEQYLARAKQEILAIVK